MAVLVIQGALAALVVKEFPFDTLRWLVAGVVILAALMMLAGAKDAPKQLGS